MSPCQTHDIPEGARYCIQCGVSVANEEGTVRLDGKRLVLGFLHGEPVFEYNYGIWRDAYFVPASPITEELWM